MISALERLLKLFFYLLYHPFARFYDWIAFLVSLGQWNEWVYSVLPYLHGPRILEIGHGPGYLLTRLHTANYMAFGLDESQQMANLARSRLRRAGVLPNLIRGHAQAIPLPEAAVDQVVCTFPSEYIFNPHALNDIWRVLSPGGQLIILPIAWFTSKKAIYRLAAWLFRITLQAPQFAPQQIGEQFCQMIRESGYQAEFEQIQKNHSLLLLIIATKPTVN